MQEPETRFSETVDYTESMEIMLKRVESLLKGEAPPLLWFLEHPPLYTKGTSGNDSDLINPQFPVYTSGRGGQITYHGTGQRVVYIVCNLQQTTIGTDLRAYVKALEQALINTLAHFNIRAHIREGRVGVWVPRPDKGQDKEDKIAAIGIRVRRWVTFHGLSLNINPNLSHFEGIIPCGIRDQGVTSFWDLGHMVTMEEVDSVLKSELMKLLF